MLMHLHWLLSGQAVHFFREITVQLAPAEDIHSILFEQVPHGWSALLLVHQSNLVQTVCFQEKGMVPTQRFGALRHSVRWPGRGGFRERPRRGGACQPQAGGVVPWPSCSSLLHDQCLFDLSPGLDGTE